MDKIEDVKHQMTQAAEHLADEIYEDNEGEDCVGGEGNKTLMVHGHYIINLNVSVFWESTFHYEYWYELNGETISGRGGE